MRAAISDFEKTARSPLKPMLKSTAGPETPAISRAAPESRSSRTFSRKRVMVWVVKAVAAAMEVVSTPAASSAAGRFSSFILRRQASERARAVPSAALTRVVTMMA
jgi:hypothetical protein